MNDIVFSDFHVVNIEEIYQMAINISVKEKNNCGITRDFKTALNRNIYKSNGYVIF